MDPFGRHTDAELLGALQQVHLTSPNSSDRGSESESSSSLHDTITISLSTPVSHGGLNLSQGQRQLLCLARAIVSRPKILVLDEATSAIDNATDALIQHSIRAEFGDSTLIVVAHRLATVADFNKILVLSDGRVVEFGTPRELWGRDSDDRESWGAFRAMCEASGDADLLRQVVLR
jgi:ABC-type multidrug transport system fused ATPase/permease subunit